MPIKVKVIHYETVDAQNANHLGVPLQTLLRLFKGEDVAVLRCVTADSLTWVTVLCSATQLQTLFESGAVKDPGGIAVSKDLFPLAWSGWGSYQSRKGSIGDQSPGQ
jgi:hypothetical protein